MIEIYRRTFIIKILFFTSSNLLSILRFGRHSITDFPYENYSNYLSFVQVFSNSKQDKFITLLWENKIKQQNLTTLLNTGYSTISSYERGMYIIATPFLYTICKKYSVSADYLLGKTDNPKSF